ncbi:MAG TPA: zinc-binding dehydrogenase [Pseudomonadota bacterium]|nr:zinc-binding dehydrogenase [Pseudomonadota bacterium]
MEPAKTSQRDVQALAGLSSAALPVVMARPQIMRALELRAYDGVSLVYVNNRPVPQPGPGEVLVRVQCAAVTEADLLLLNGRYGVQRNLPIVPGIECSGLVVQSGGGLLARALVGRRVACIASSLSDGTWAEYVCVPAWQCVPLRSFVSYEGGANLLSTGIMAWALLDTARSRGSRGVAHTAGDSPLGRMLAQLSLRRRVPMLHVIERGEQGEALSGLGATHILNSGSTMFPQQLANAFDQHGISVVLEANAGLNSDLLLRALPTGGSLIMCGSQPDVDCTFDPSELVYRHKRLEGFLLSDWLSHAGYARVVQAALVVQRLLSNDSRGEAPSLMSLDNYHTALELVFRRRMSPGRILFVLHRDN